jgi:hypothetical protein
MRASCFAKSRTLFLFCAVPIFKKTLIKSKPSLSAAVPGGPGRDARSLATFGPFRLPFMFRPIRRMIGSRRHSEP